MAGASYDPFDLGEVLTDEDWDARVYSVANLIATRRGDDTDVAVGDANLVSWITWDGLPTIPEAAKLVEAVLGIVFEDNGYGYDSAHRDGNRLLTISRRVTRKEVLRAWFAHLNIEPEQRIEAASREAEMCTTDSGALDVAAALACDRLEVNPDSYVGAAAELRNLADKLDDDYFTEIWEAAVALT